jgi:hypothetical protein
MAERNLRINLVLSVLPAPLSPLKDKMYKFVLLSMNIVCTTSLVNGATIFQQNNCGQVGKGTSKYLLQKS